MDAFTPQQTAELVSRIGAKKSHMRLDKLWWNSFMTGPLIGFGCAVALSIETAPWYQESAPGLIRMIGAIIFPVGLVMVVLSGADLFTSNVMFMTVAFLHRRVTLLDLLKIWFISFFGNLAGMLFFVALIAGYGGVFELAAYRQQTINFATLKAVDPRWHQIFLRGIGANWLVCFAVFISISSREIVSKIIAIWWPTCTFVALGLDHVVANMFFIPISIWNAHPDISVPFYIYKSLIPTLLGNIVGGGVFVGAMYWYLYLMGTGAIDVDFNTSGGLGNAVEGRTQVIDVVKQQQESGVSSGETLNSQQLPHPGSGMRSGIGKELDVKLYAKSKAERTDEEKAAAQI